MGMRRRGAMTGEVGWNGVHRRKGAGGVSKGSVPSGSDVHGCGAAMAAVRPWHPRQGGRWGAGGAEVGGHRRRTTCNWTGSTSHGTGAALAPRLLQRCGHMGSLPGSQPLLGARHDVLTHRLLGTTLNLRRCISLA